MIILTDIDAFSVPPSLYSRAVHIIIAADGSATLNKPAEFTAFDVRAADAPAALAALGDEASVAPEADHVFVTVAAVRRLAGDAADAEWEAGFAKMLDFAASKGWMNDTSTSIKAHIDPS
ncbi:MAG: hypothetical protein ACI8TP_003167 [Acidimicrobiales bacterium]